MRRQDNVSVHAHSLAGADRGVPEVLEREDAEGGGGRRGAGAPACL